MKSRILMGITAMTLFAGLAVPVPLAAQERNQNERPKRHRYTFFEVPTFGGPNFHSNFSGPQNSLLSQNGTLVGGADTSVADPFCFNLPDCFVEHAFKFERGVLTDLGTLPGGVNSQAFWINASGLTVGLAQNTKADPYLGIQELRAVVWEHGKIINLGTFGGHESLSQAVNDRGQVVGVALNTIPDPISPFGLYVGTQMRAFLWEKGVIRDLGTLGGPDAWARYINNGDQAVGVSFTDSAINPAIGQPTTHSFLWQHGKMTDLGTLGGSFSEPEGLNNRGQVVGNSSLKGDVDCNGSPMNCDQHAFLWEQGQLMDIGTLGGSFALAMGVNDSGQIVWEEGGPMLDLNMLIPPGSGLQLTNAFNINDRGEILARFVPIGAAHFDDESSGIVLLIPCKPGEKEGCEANAGTAASMAPRTLVPTLKDSTTATWDQPRLTPSKNIAAWQLRFAQRHHIPGLGAPMD